MLGSLFNYTVPICASMFFTFLYELTSFEPLKRTRLFRTELTKVFVACIIVYALALTLTTWLHTMSLTIKHAIERKEKDIAKQHRNYALYVKRYRANNRNVPDDQLDIPPLKLTRSPTTSEIEVAQFEEKGLKDQSVAEMVDYLVSKFNVYLDDHCIHLLDKSYKT